MSIVDGNWKTFMARATVLSAMLGVVVFGAVRLASARDGVPGSARTWVTFAGVVSGLPGDPRTANMRFSFHRSSVGADAGVPPSLCAPTVRDVSISTTGAFSAQIPLDDATSPCPSDMFDGRDVQVDVDVGMESIVRNASINPVPYAHFASVAGQYGTPDCPVGYERATDAAFTGDMRLCQRSRMEAGTRVIYDEVVRVGVGASAFWIDRYEASVWESSIGVDSTPLFRTTGDFNAVTFPVTGQWTVALYALSRGGVNPARSVTWFQAQSACRTSGKRLATGEEWLSAARRTNDPTGANDGAMNSLCNTGGTRVRDTGGGVGCASAWGAQDMIGNLPEWTAEWAIVSAIRVAGGVSGGTGLSVELYPGQGESASWSATPGFPRDTVVGSANRASWRGGGDFVSGLPASVMRGGGYSSGEGAGVFAMQLDTTPSGSAAGLRCVIPR